MCIAIVQRSNVPINKERLKICWERNSDGGGIAWRTQDNVLKIYKSLSQRKFFRKYNILMQSNDVQYPIFVHMRIKTSGPIDLDNCHPFWVNEDMVMMHNGVIRKVISTKEKSDTRVFVEEVLTPLAADFPKFVENEAIQELIDDYIGFSRVITLESDGTCHIFNESTGHDETDGNWYSNKTYELTTSRYGNTSRNNWLNSTYYDDPTKSTNREGVFYFNTQKRRYVDGAMFAWIEGLASHTPMWREIDAMSGAVFPEGEVLSEWACDTRYKDWKEREEKKHNKDKSKNLPAVINAKNKIINISDHKKASLLSQLGFKASGEVFKCEFCGQDTPNDLMVLISAKHEDRGRTSESAYAICSVCHLSVIDNWGLNNIEVIIDSVNHSAIKEVLH